MIKSCRVLGFIGGGGYGIPEAPSGSKRLAVVGMVTGGLEFSAPQGRLMPSTLAARLLLAVRFALGLTSWTKPRLA
jgi:hypothetical protein